MIIMIIIVLHAFRAQVKHRDETHDKCDVIQRLRQRAAVRMGMITWCILLCVLLQFEHELDCPEQGQERSQSDVTPVTPWHLRN